MELKPLPPEFDELRKVIISSNLTTCYLMLPMFPSEEEEHTYYEEFRTRWTDNLKIFIKLSLRCESLQEENKSGQV